MLPYFRNMDMAPGNTGRERLIKRIGSLIQLVLVLHTIRRRRQEAEAAEHALHNDFSKVDQTFSQALNSEQF